MRGATVAVVVALAVLVGFPGFASPTALGGDTRAGLVLKVGGQDEMKTLNPLPALAGDVWTRDVLGRAYDSVLLRHWVLDKPMAYIAKGVDYDEDGMFDRSEYDVWAEQSPPASALNVTAYYDFNGVKWHDGVQMTPWDLLFSYHVNAMNARFNTDIRAVFAAGSSTSYEAGDRQLNIRLATKNWEGEGTIPGDPTLRVAIEFRLTGPFVRFYDASLFPDLFPMHEWSVTGGLRSDGTQRHGDFGCAVWIPPAEASAKGIPACTPNPPDATKHGKGIASTETVPGSHPYYYADAEAWTMIDEDVIGNGPFAFDTLVRGVEAKVSQYEDYFVGVDPDNPSIVYDPILVSRLKKPTIEGIRFLVYKTTQLGVFALQSAEVDFYHWNVGAEFVPDLLKIPEIAVESNAEPGFFYMAYNLRRQPWGYVNQNPANDAGFWLRQAFSHLIDKKSIVQNLLQNFGVIGHGTISPANTFWYNDNIPKPDYNLTQAAAILDDMALPGGNIPQIPGFTLDPPGACSKDTPSGCRSLPTIGNAAFDILTPQADYDPVRASAGAMIGDAMRRVGVNVGSKPTGFGTIMNQMHILDFDVFILDWRIDGADPDYLFSYFHSSNAATGQNYPGFQNSTFDQAIEDSRAELDRDTRQSLIFQAQQILAEARPYDVLYFRTNIEAYRQDRFVNWTVQSGTIWGYWSLQSIHAPRTRLMDASISAVSAMAAGAEETVTVAVLRDDRTPLRDAAVTLSAEAGWDDGRLILGTQSGTSVSGVTDLLGTLQAAYTAPVVLSKTLAIIRVRASHPDYPDSACAQTSIVVYPPNVSFLSLKLDLPLGDAVPIGASIPMQVEVRDESRAVVPDANVGVATSDPTDLRPVPARGLAVNMTHVSLNASELADPHTVVVTVSAAHDGYQGGTASISVQLVHADFNCSLSIRTDPTHLWVRVNGEAEQDPYLASCSCGSVFGITLEAQSPQVVDGTMYLFSHWSDGGAQSHTVGCGSYVAHFDAYPLALVVGIPILAGVTIPAFILWRRRTRKRSRKE